MKVENWRGTNDPHIDYEFNKGFIEKYLQKVEFGTQVSAIFEKSAKPRYLMIEIQKKGDKFYSPISLHQSTDKLRRNIESIFERIKYSGHIRFKGK